MSTRVIDVVLAVLGAGLVLISLGSSIKVLVLPRADQSRFARLVHRLVTWFVGVIGRRINSYSTLDGFLANAAVLRLGILAGSWLISMWVGYAAMLRPFVGHDTGAAFREAGSSMLTLGFATTGGFMGTAVDLLAGLSGFGLITMFIAYLPSLYAAFNRRETLVTMLDSRGGTPPWGPEILARHQLVTVSADLADFYSSWEAWAAEVAESHTTYPILVGFRSPHPDRSWLVALLAVMDAAALHLALNPTTCPSSARLCIRMGFVSLRNVADTVGIPYNPDPHPSDPIALDRSEFDNAVALLKRVGFPVEVDAEEAWPHFSGWRINYESVAYKLADRINAPPAAWSGPRSLFDTDVMYPIRPEHRSPTRSGRPSESDDQQ